ncbi:sugar ABC transporter ATP-binding protein [Clostridium sp. SYSU_GA19001]|uniref:sugar ABC transporter ATP-binding protein n=1 Tax=Clostridium caldaquaticum TaxID=2940653 RepID=UPI00207785A5|nr:sugar ABC transporter ATP-binding protein [Clostridium caldaquaticum]MCM8709963.1 sugar ABC transporter ATP-binding protein [Clostridium caldaquaticum]
MEEKEIILQIEGLDKHFGPTHANKHIDFSLKKGEIRGLVGENGSGKSTLLSMISGINKCDSGKMYLKGEEYAPKSPLDANDKGIAIVVQELGLVNSLPAGINVYLGKTKQFSSFGIVSLKKIYKACNEVLKKWELPEISFHKKSGEMNVENRKMVELARALSTDPEILILDEVTQALSHDNRLKLYELIKKFKKMERSIILITHDLEEMLEITDSISILRDGELISTEQSRELTIDELKTKMVGRQIEGEYYRADHEELYEDEIVLSVNDLETQDGLKNISFELHKGEILGFCGLSDSGIHTIGKAVYGLTKVSKGTVNLTSMNVRIKKSSQALKYGIAYVPKDRDGEALMMNASIRENFTMPSTDEIKNRFGYLSNEKISKMAEEATKLFNVKCVGIYQLMSGLSGGNKQKVNLGRWLIKDIKVLVVDCPTRGVDIGVKAYLYQCLKDIKKKGIGIILITDELPEAIGMCDNIIIMKSGKIVTKLPRSSHFSEESIIEVMV